MSYINLFFLIHSSPGISGGKYSLTKSWRGMKWSLETTRLDIWVGWLLSGIEQIPFKEVCVNALSRDIKDRKSVLLQIIVKGSPKGLDKYIVLINKMLLGHLEEMYLQLIRPTQLQTYVCCLLAGQPLLPSARTSTSHRQWIFNWSPDQVQKIPLSRGLI